MLCPLQVVLLLPLPQQGLHQLVTARLVVLEHTLSLNKKLLPETDILKELPINLFVQDAFALVLLLQ